MRESGGFLFWVGVVVLAGALIASFDDPFNGGFGLLPLVLIGIGVALWTRDGDRSTSPPPAQTTWPATTPTAGAVMPTTQSPPAAPPAVGGTPPPAQPPAARPTSPQPAPAGPPPPPRPRSPLGAITLGLALIATGLVALLDRIEGLPLDADPSHLAAVALLVLGLGQLVGAFWGRARWLSLVALFLIPPVLVGALVRGVDADFDLDGISLGDGVGERTYVIDGEEDLPRDVGLAAGNIEFDLSDWQPTAGTLATLDDDPDVTIDVGAGEVSITTPTDVPWRLVGEVRLGEINVIGSDGEVTRTDTENAGIPLDVELSGGPQDGDVLDIDVDVRLGQLTIPHHHHHHHHHRSRRAGAVMTRHKLDLFSLISGLVLVGIATAALFDISADVTVWVWPSLLIAVGVVVLASVLRTTGPDGPDGPGHGEELPAHHVEDDPERSAALASARAEVDDADTLGGDHPTD